MSDPVTNVEIEDVLSSIRRLVSADERPAKPNATPSRQVPEKLVLTPALRVDDTTGPADDLSSGNVEIDGDTIIFRSEDAEPVLGQDRVIDDTPSVDAPEQNTQEQSVTMRDPMESPPASEASLTEGLEQSVEIVTAQDAQGDEVEQSDGASGSDDPEAPTETPETDQVQAAELCDPEPFVAPAQHDENSIRADELGEAETDETAAVSGMDETPSDSVSLHDRAAEFEKVVAERDDHWEPDGTETHDNAAQPTTSLVWQDDLPSEPDDGDTEAPTEPEASRHEADVMEGLEPFEPEDDAPDMLEESEPVEGVTEAPAEPEVSRHEADVMEGLEPFEPEDDAPDMLDESEPETEDVIAENTDDALFVHTASENAFVSDDELLDDEDGAILDEEALRDLVAEIVRQELQGSLGERITRNVRKLVRREIQRALAAKELE